MKHWLNHCLCLCNNSLTFITF
uniref:Uncharacterized protein n=1 Tax=Anguilla anguilla TaxID=7936 RepID=A0A0E9RBU7_ANGAN